MTARTVAAARASSHRPPGPSEVDVWLADLSAAAPPRGLDDLLSDEESRRAERFRFQEDRRAFEARRWILRSVLAAYLEVDPRQVRLREDEGGKPLLAHPAAPGLHFSLSHSGGLAALAVAGRPEMGVDLERIRELPEARRIAERFFAPGERRGLDDPALPFREGFFLCWTGKEAFVKAVGQGLAFPLQEVEVAVSADRRRRYEQIEGDPGEARRWSLLGLATPRDYVGAVALRHPAARLRHQGWW